jgi:hypothetical protein
MNTQFNYVTEKQFLENLESVIDSKGMNYLLACLQQISEEKAQHVSENWQDMSLSSAWLKTANKLEQFRLKNETLFPL